MAYIVHVSENQSFCGSCSYVVCRKPNTEHLLPAGHHIENESVQMRAAIYGSVV